MKIAKPAISQQTQIGWRLNAPRTSNSMLRRDLSWTASMRLLHATGAIRRIVLMRNAIPIPTVLTTRADLRIAGVAIRILTRATSRTATRAAQNVTIPSVLFIVGGKWRRYAEDNSSTGIILPLSGTFFALQRLFLSGSTCTFHLFLRPDAIYYPFGSAQSLRFLEFFCFRLELGYNTAGCLIVSL